ncbi:MAG TPA: alanine racemase [Verrucomicrobiae bacterium]|nr:alanine racemase [Verrucomicrobiae bacterium]
MELRSKTEPSAWMEVDLRQFRANWEVIARSPEPRQVGTEIAYVIKDDAYGHGARELAKVALHNGAQMLAVASVAEGVDLREHGIEAPILVLAERSLNEYAVCAENNLAPCVGSHAGFEEIKKLRATSGRPLPIHLKIDTGMSRFGFRWSSAEELIEALRDLPNATIAGVMSHFAMSDELDKSFARLQLSRFNEVLSKLLSAGISPRYKHICNSGGFLDLPEAHFNLVRIGILPLGVYPSKVCHRLEGIAPIMSVKSRLAAIKELQPGDHVGYGMRFTADKKMPLGVIPIGYGLGYPRVRNQGHVLIRGRRAPIIGGVSMDAITVDLSAIPEVRLWDTVTLLGREDAEEISIHDLAALKNSVSYDAMVSWSARLPRRYLK